MINRDCLKAFDFEAVLLLEISWWEAVALEGVELKIKVEPLDKAETGVIEEADAD